MKRPYDASVDKIDVEEVRIGETDGADACSDRRRIAAPYERNRNVSPIVCPDEKPVVVPDGGDDTLYTPEIGCDDDGGIHVGHILKRRRVAGFIVCAAQRLYLLCTGDIDGVSAEKAASSLVKHECPRDAHFCAEKAIEIVSRQIRSRNRGMERAAASPDD